MSSPNLIATIKDRMREEKLPEVVINTFEYYYRQLLDGNTGLIPEESIRPAEAVPHAGDLTQEHQDIGRNAVPKTVIFKLNGGLGTSMGMQQAKTLLRIKKDLSFLDVIARHALHTGVPLVLMNSFVTQQDSLKALANYPELLNKTFGIDFLQHKFPKISQSTLQPAIDPQTQAVSWNPPGHGDLYTALVTSGLLDKLVKAGFEYAFVSNGDNLGAALNHEILGFFVKNRMPFMMEVANRTDADRKGGHLAVNPKGRLLLRESAQCPPNDQAAFQDIQKHPYFNTNNLWFHLPTLKNVMAEKENILGLPLIRNSKTVDPRDPDSEKVFQLETAMGSAISVFEGAQALCVPRTRFSPVKTTDDLLAVRSDAYKLTEDFRVVPASSKPPTIELDPQHYRLIDQLDAHFPAGPPSLIECTRLRIEGDVAFGAGVKIKGNVEIRNPDASQLVIPDGLLLTGN